MRRRNIYGVMVLASLFVGRAIVAQTPAPTAPGAAGPNYWVSYVSEGAESVWLEEKQGSGAWQTVPNSSTSPVAFTNKPSGTYFYRKGEVFIVGYDMYYDQWIYQVYYSPSSQVTVLANRDTLPTQLTYQYQTRSGDINYDGRTDLFVRRTSGGSANNGVLENVILQQNSYDGTFSTVVPSASQYNTAIGWPTSSATVVVDDLNVDGFVDVAVKGVAAATGGASNQIVFSPASTSATPKGLRAVDSSLTQFVGNSLDQVAKPQYIESRAVLQPFVGYLVVFSCSFGPVGVLDDIYYSFPIPCVMGVVYISGSYWDYRGLSEQAVSMWLNEKANREGTATDAISTQKAQEAAESVIGVQIGGSPVEEIFGPDAEHANPDVRRGLETFWSILGIARANSTEVQTEEAPQQGPLSAGTVYLTGHHVFGLGILPLHTALQLGGTPLTLSAISSPLPIVGPFLKKRTAPLAELMNMRLGTISDGSPAALYCLELAAAHSNYDDDLLYLAFPFGLFYNSNGYINGLIQHTGGILSPTTLSMSNFVGGAHAVPSVKFQ
jgi:hypothetical protein